MPDGKLTLIPVPPTHIDFAWRDGAGALAEACATSGGEVTGDQLKMILARGERTLLQMRDGDSTVGWAVVRVDQLPNFRVIHVCELVAHNAGFERFFSALAEIAVSLGCSRIRCSAKPAQARLYRGKCGFVPVYETLEVPI